MEPFDEMTVQQRMVPASKVLRAAAEILGRGWCQKHMGEHEGEWVTFQHLQPGAMMNRLCLVGAITQAAVDLVGASVGSLARSECDLPPESMAARQSMRRAVGVVERQLKPAPDVVACRM